MRALIITSSYTNTTYALDKYLHEIGQIDLLTIEEEIQLSAKVRNGDPAAKERFVKANLRFVVSIAKKYLHQGLSLDDLVAEGNFGLFKAVERFDSTKGFKFISFAVWWIRQSIMHAIADKRRLIRLPGNQLVGIHNIEQAKDRLEQELERQPTIAELSAYLALTEEKVKDFMSSSPGTLSLDTPFQAEDAASLLDVIPSTDTQASDEGLMADSTKIEVEQILSKLAERDQLLLKLHFGLGGHEPLDLGEVAAELNLSKERVRQIKNKLLKSLQRRYPNRSSIEELV